MKRLQIPQKLVYEKFYIHEFYVLPEKLKENILTKQPRFKSRLITLKISQKQ